MNGMTLAHAFGFILLSGW